MRKKGFYENEGDVKFRALKFTLTIEKSELDRCKVADTLHSRACPMVFRIISTSIMQIVVAAKLQWRGASLCCVAAMRGGLIGGGEHSQVVKIAREDIHQACI